MSGVADSGILLNPTLNARPRTLLKKGEVQLSDNLKAADRNADCEVASIVAHWRKCVFFSHMMRLERGR